MLFRANGVKLIKLVFSGPCKHGNNNRINCGHRILFLWLQHYPSCRTSDLPTGTQRHALHNVPSAWLLEPQRVKITSSSPGFISVIVIFLLSYSDSLWQILMSRSAPNVAATYDSNRSHHLWQRPYCRHHHCSQLALSKSHKSC